MNDRPRVLIVDADPQVLPVASRLLRQAGYQVLEAMSGEQALHLAAEHSPDLLLVALVLPDADGIGLCRQLKADPALAGSLVVLVSAINTSSEDPALGLECGADGYISQPIPDREFVARVKTFLRLQRALAERDAAVEALQAAHDRPEAHVIERRSAEQALRDSEDRLRAILEHPGVGIVVVQDGQQVFYNARMYEMVGYAEEEYAKRCFLSLIHPEDREFVAGRIRRRLAGAAPHSSPRRIRIMAKSGEIRWIETSFVRIQWEGRPAVQAFVFDCTERKRAEEALRESENRYRVASELTSDYAYAYRVEPDGELVNEWVTGALARVTGHSPQELRSLGGWEYLIHPDDRTIALGQLQSLLSDEAKTVEYRIVAKDGQVRWMRDYARPKWNAAESRVTRIEGAVQDITERVRAEHATRERQRYLESVLSAAPDAIVTLDPHGRIVDWNSGAERLFGYHRQKIIGQDMDSLIARGEMLEEAATFTGLVSGGGTLPPTETVRYRRDGSPVNVVVSGAPIVVDDELVGVVAMYTDVTARKLTEEALQQRASQLALLNEIGRRVTAFLNLDEVLHRAAQLVQERFGFHHVGLFTKAAGEDGLVMRARAGDFAPLFPPDHSVALGQGLVGRAALRGKTILANDVESEPYHVNLHSDRLPTRSQLSVPIRAGDQIAGVLDLQSPQPNAFDPSDVTTLETLADWLAVAIQNARLFQETQQQLDELSLLFAASVTFSISLDLDTVLETTARQITAALQAQGCAISLWDREQDALVTMLDYSLDLDPWDPDPPGTSYPLADYPISRRVVVDRQPIVVHVDDPGADPAELVWMTAQEVKSLAMVPLVARDQAIGLLELVEVHEKRDFSAGEMRLIQTLANQTAAALENARLYEEARRRSRELALLNRVIAATAAAGETLEPILEIICRELALAFEVTQVAAALFNEEKSEAVVVAEYLDNGGPSSLGDSFLAADTPATQDLLTHKTPLVIEDAETDPRQAPMRDQMRWRGIRSLLLLPLMVDAEVVGTLGVAALEPRAFSAEEVNLAWRVAEQASSVVARARLWEERRQLEGQFHQAQKMEAVGRLAGGVAHDFNNLLTVIHLSVRLLERALHLEDPLWPHVQRINDAGQRATSLTKQLLAFSRREIVELQVLSLNQVLGELDKMLQRLISEDIAMTTRLADDLWPVEIDPTQVEQVVVNLAVNAGDAMPGGGKLTIETANVVLDEAYAAHHLEVEPGEYVMLAVSDTGVGMNQEVKARLFEPFFTTKERGKGTGLGLATVFGIVKQNRGHIAVYSEPDQGTTFKVYLPRVKGVPVPAHRPLPYVEPTARGSETLLVVEDEAQVRELIRDILVAQGYRVLTAEDGVDALQVAQGHEGPIHLLISDVVMPRMSGRALADQLRSTRHEIRMLFISGYTDDAIVHHGVLAEGIHFLSKPFELEALAQKVRAVLDA